MITKLLRKVFRREPAGQPAGQGREPAVIARAQHGIHRDMLSPAAIKVCEGLQGAGHRAFVVGGAVRDLIAGIVPKDVDVPPTPRPRTVVAVFPPRAHDIGRRFRIVHSDVRPRDHRGVHLPRHERRGGPTSTAAILRDNVWGSQAEDAARRDFTVNALYYDPPPRRWWTYTHGVADLKQKTCA